MSRCGKSGAAGHETFSLAMPTCVLTDLVFRVPAGRVLAKTRSD